MPDDDDGEAFEMAAAICIAVVLLAGLLLSAAMVWWV
jgi:hypothetical protein